MTTTPDPHHETAPLVQPFPPAGPLMRLALRELDIAENGTEAQSRPLGDPRLLPRPWDPATCQTPQLRQELWTWLDAVVTWINTEYVWDVAGTIPSCWPHHPHLVHEIAVLADQRRAATAAYTSDALENWHRYTLPAFTDRMKARTKNHCDEGHHTSPAKGRHARHLARNSRHDRAAAFSSDARTIEQTELWPQIPRLGVVDLNTGEIKDP